MSQHAEGTFTVASWDESTYDELDGKGKLTKASIGFDFTGGMTAHGAWQAVMCYRPDGTAVFTGFQRMSGELDGRAGTFVVRGDGTWDSGEARTSWAVVDGSGTGGLAGLRGSGESVAGAGQPGGTFTFDYELG